MKLGEQLLILVLKACHCVGAPCAACVCPVALVGELDLKLAKTVSSQGVLATTTLVGGRDGVGGATARVWLKPWLILCSSRNPEGVVSPMCGGLH